MLSSLFWIKTSFFITSGTKSHLFTKYPLSAHCGIQCFIKMISLNPIITQGGGHHHFHLIKKDVTLREVKESTQGHTAGKWQNWDLHPGLAPETLGIDLRSSRGPRHGTESLGMPTLPPWPGTLSQILPDLPDPGKALPPAHANSRISSSTCGPQLVPLTTQHNH